MFKPPEPRLDELHEDADAIAVLLASGLLDRSSQVLMHNHLRALERSIIFIEKMGAR